MLGHPRLGPYPHSFDPVLGDPRLLEGVKQLEFKAAGVEGRQRALRHQLGDTGLEQFAAGLTPATAKLLLTPPLSSVWVPFTRVAEIDAMYILDVHRGDVAKFGGLIADLARFDMREVYSFLLQSSSPDVMIKRLSAMLTTKIRPTAVETVQVGPRELAAFVREGPLPFYFCEHGVTAWARTALQTTGATDAEAVQVACRHFGAPACEYRFSW